MGKSLSAQQGGDLTESLALGFQAWHQAPPPPKGTWRVGQGGTCPLPSVGSQGEFRVWAWQLIPPGAGMRLLILCPSKPGFSLGSWWCLLTGVTGSQGSYVCLALLCPAGSKPQHTVCHLITIVRGGKGLPNPQLLLIFGIQIWILDVHQEAGSMHFN